MTMSWGSISIMGPQIYEKLVSYYSDIVEYNEKFVVSSGIRTRIFGFSDHRSTHCLIKGIKSTGIADRNPNNTKLLINAITVAQKPSNWHKQHFKFFKEAK
jgi:hypothetical protein